MVREASAATEESLSTEHDLQELRKELEKLSAYIRSNSIRKSSNRENTGSVYGTHKSGTPVRLSAAEIFSEYSSTVHQLFTANADKNGDVRSLSSGSAIMITQSIMVTNFHAVEDNNTVATLDPNREGREIYWHLIDFDEKADVALLFNEGRRYRPATLGSLKDICVGDRVHAIGSPKNPKILYRKRLFRVS